MCYAHQVLPLSAGYGSHESARSLARLRNMGVNWISVTPFGFQRDPQGPTFGWVANLEIAETDERVRGAIRQARALGIEVMMKPHIWLSAPHWPGSIAPLADHRASWFQTYEQFILHYALLSEQEGVGALCIGNELSKMTAHESEWRRIISAVRRVYSGALTYAAETGSSAESVGEVRLG
ncbi:MAG: glycoside hydrolase family 113 [Thermoanaerobaculia bacterium]